MEEKINFLKNQFIKYLKKVSANEKGAWGVLNGQQMVEHFSDSVRIASGNFGITHILTPPDHLQKLYAFMMSEKPFKENTSNSLMSDVPIPVRHSSFEASLDELQHVLDYFFWVFENNVDFKTINPFFGNLNYKENVQLLYKHALHHLRQFGLSPS